MTYFYSHTVFLLAYFSSLLTWYPNSFVYQIYYHPLQLFHHEPPPDAGQGPPAKRGATKAERPERPIPIPRFSGVAACGGDWRGVACAVASQAPLLHSQQGANQVRQGATGFCSEVATAIEGRTLSAVVFPSFFTAQSQLEYHL